MIHIRTLQQWFGIITLVSLFLCNNMAANAATGASDEKTAPRADIITIDTMKSLGDLERPPVVFYHEKHVTAIQKKGKDCTVCHLEEDKKLSLKYMRLKDEGYDAVMNIYHNNCISCHKDTASAGEWSGPVECGECHKKNVEVLSNWQPMGFDKSLHYRHSKAQEEKCEACHHAYNESTKTLFYDKGKEGSCGYCHKEKTEENRIAGQFAAHIACIDCHRKTIAKDKEAGPITCNGCHDPEDQELIAKVDPVPRMKRNQPDVVLLTAHGKTSSGNSNPDLIRMNPVAFDHAAHEKYNDTCRACHHADLNTCGSCHTLSGSKEGNYIKLEQAMHRMGAESSCIGCHTERQTDKNCAGCHASIPKNRKQDSAACLACHATPPTGTMMSSNDTDVAKALLSSRTPVTGTYSQADIPEKVIIKAISKEYEPAELPHRKIINTLLKNIKDDKLAGYFHRDEGTMCQGCHHHSPAAKKPPSCSSCHGAPFDENNILRPGLKAAYHRQCMECHEVMGIEKPVATDCTGCHKKKT